jgi:hypothetical protein
LVELVWRNGMTRPISQEAQMNTMLILPGNAAGKGKYPDEHGNTDVAWPTGALHRDAAREYALRRSYEPEVVEVLGGGHPQSEKSPQANKAIEKFLGNRAITAFFGFSGGGGNLMYILERLAKDKPQELSRIELLVVLGAHEWPRNEFELSKFTALIQKGNKRLPAGAVPARPPIWKLEYRNNPPPDHPVVPKGAGSHMFGPEWLLWLLEANRFIAKHPSLVGGPGPYLKPPQRP